MRFSSTVNQLTRSLGATVQGRLSALLVVAFALLPGCDFSFFHNEKPRYYSYCDDTGCYTCTPSGCFRGGGVRPGEACRSDVDCAEGCFCDGRSDTCVEAGFCDDKLANDCPQGFVCDEGRRSCIPEGKPTSGGDDAGTSPTGRDAGVAADDAGGGGGGADLAECTDGGVKPANDAGVIACAVDCDCPRDQQCTAGKCTPIIRPDWSCVFDYECSGGRCVNSQCEKKCAGNADCGTGNICVAGYCAPNPAPAGCVYNKDCPANNTCVNGTCYPACAADKDCANKADFCDKGLCRPDWRKKPECMNNAQCAVGEECVNAVCRTPCIANRDCGNCVDGPLCYQGYCTTQSEAAPQCKAKADCAANQSCVNALCK